MPTHPDKKRFTVDAMDGGQARLEDPGGGMVHGPSAQLPGGAREGSVLSRGMTGGFALDKGATASRQAAMQGRRDSLPQAPGGDLNLSPGTLRGSATGTLRRAVTALRDRFRR